MPYKLTVGSHTTHGKTYRAGYEDLDTIDDGILTENEIKTLGDRIIKVEGGAAEDGTKEELTPLVPTVATTSHVTVDTADIDTATTAESDLTIDELLAKNVVEIESEVEDITDEDLLNSIQQAEIKGKGRAGVFKAIEAKKGELRAK